MAIEIPVITTYNSTGLKKAERDLQSFTGVLKKFGLARKLSIAGLTTAAGIYAKKSIAAAIAEDKAQKKLFNTLQNIGKSFASGSVNQYIKDTENLTNVTKEQLRPELEKLMRVTSTVGEAQDILNTALNIAAGSSYNLSQITTALAKAQTGNFTALKKMTLGLDKATIESGNFYLIQEQLNKLFSGQAIKSADSFEGRLGKISRAAGEAKEIIGKSLLTSINGVIDSAGGIDTVTQSMLNLATAAGKVAEASGLVAQGVVGNVPSKSLLQRLADNFAQFGASMSGFGGNFRPFGQGVGRNLPKATIGLEKYSEDKRMGNRVRELKIQSGITRLTKEQLAAQRRIAASKKLQAKFDQDIIAIEAALKGKLSDEDKKRLLALKAAKTESNADDQKALEDLNAAQKKSAAEELASIEERKKASLDAIAKQKSEYQALTEWLKSNPINVYTQFVNQAGQLVTVPGSFGVPGTNATSSAPPTTNASNGGSAGLGGSNLQYGTYGATGDINITVNAGTIADENKLVYIIADQITKFQRFGGVTAPAGFI